MSNIGQVVKIDSVPGLRDWLEGKEIPHVGDDPEPYSWAYYRDYLEFLKSNKYAKLIE